MRDKDGKPTHMICTASPVDPLHHVTSKVNRLLEENIFPSAIKGYTPHAIYKSKIVQ